jgi:hypothetical protein
MANNPHGHGGEIQKMIFDKNLPENHPHKQFEGQPKGMKIILAEQGYTMDHNGKNLIGDCKACKALKARKPHLERVTADKETDMYGDDGNNMDEEDEWPVDCCMRCLLSLQPDFTGQKSQLELVSFIYHVQVYITHLVKAHRGDARHGLPFSSQVSSRDESH